MLDELLGAGEVVWTGAGTLPGSDGWVQLHPADLVLPVLRDVPEPDAVGQAVLDALDGGGAFLFRQLTAALGETDDSLVADALWQLVWSGRVAGDTFAPLRAMLGGRGAHRSSSRSPRARLRSGRGRAASPRLAQQGPPTVSGRWFRLDAAETDPTKLQLARTEALLARYGVVTRGSVVAEQTPGGFAATYRVLRELEQTGACLRGYYVDTLGAAQFASPATVDRLRSHQRDDDQPVEAEAIVLAATDPANPFGAALPWPDVVDADESSRHRPARKAGSLAVIHDGHAVLYLERGGRKVLVLDDDPRRLAPAATALAALVRTGRVPRLTVETAGGRSVGSTAPRRGAARGRVRPAPEGPAARCPKVTPSGAPRGCCTTRSPAGRSPRSDIRVPQWATLDLSGVTVDDAVSRGKHLFVRAGDVSLHTHLKMEGVWHVYPPGGRWRRPAHMARVVLENADHQAVGFSLGLVEVLDRAAEDDAMAWLGPDLLGPDWSLDEAVRRVTADPDATGVPRPARPAQPRRVRQRVRQRALLPARPAAHASGRRGRRHRPRDRARATAHHRQLRARACARSPTAPAAATSTGCSGATAVPCRRCGTTVERGELGDDPIRQRNTFWCPRCQT